MEKVILVTVSTEHDEDDGDSLYTELLEHLEHNDCVTEYTIRDGGIA